MTYVLDRVEGAYPELPEPDHIEEVLQGTADFIAGVEGFSGAYTRAQQYLWSCLESSDTVSYKARVGGMEGMIGDGFSAAWEYVAKIFKSLWNFFFGSGEDAADTKADKVEKKAEETEKKMQKLESGNISEEQAKDIVKKSKTKAQKIQKDPKSSPTAKSKAKAVEDKINTKSSTEESRKFVTNLVEELMRIDADLPVKLTTRINGINSTVTNWETRITNAKAEAIKDATHRATYVKVKDESQAAATVIKNLGLKPITEIVYPDAKKMVANIRKAIKAARAMLAKFKSHKGEIDTQLAKLKENASNTNGGSDKKKKSTGGSETEDLKKIASLLTSAATAHVTIINHLSTMIDTLDDAIEGSVLVI